MLAGGGTGGHVYPALSVAEALRRLEPAAQFLYIGTARGAEQRLVPAAGLPFRAIKAGQIRGKSPFNVTRSASRLSIGVLESRRILTAFRPHAVFATGGYASVPVALAARLSGLPLIVFLPDIYPGWAVRLSAGLASRVATTTEAAQRYL
ncbi:MAG: UDP-N-acetylglucosamine--N-acetylmuramyl-(pentapeptide) pyrophosphoryl-undecaprenol N-acetylglucosamine transferase, partial [Dehalococcoidia bacterium]